MLADNRFDNLCGMSELDFDIQTSHQVHYVHRPEGHYIPACTAGPFNPIPNNVGTYPGCMIFPFTEPGPQSALEWEALAVAERTAYGDLRYLYDGLIDGGSTAEVLDEIVTPEPQDYLNLSSYLMGKSPYLSVEALKAAMEKPGFPSTLRSQVCIANPEATQQDGFMRWLAQECTAPLPAHLLAAIEASWEQKTYRWYLEAAMAGHQANQSQAVHSLLEELDDPELFDAERFRAGLQLLRTVDARYAESFLLMEQHRYSEAQQVIDALSTEERLRQREFDERDRMLWWIAYLSDLHQEGRTLGLLTPGEVQGLAAFIAPHYDRVTNAISQTLCFHYDECRPPITGGDEAPKSLRRAASPVAVAEPQARLHISPNPAAAWAVVNWEGATEPSRIIVVRDFSGREALRRPASGTQGEAALDIRPLAPGTYVVELVGSQGALARAKLIVQ